MLQKRLLAAMDLVRPGSRVADIGTDHAYLPIELVKQGISPVAIAADVREGPLRMAQRNIERAGLGARIETVLSDGLTEIAESRYDDLIICGMGGDTIVQILEAAELKNPEKRLILQPQSVSDRLRAYLYRSGYEILCERFVWDMGKLYLLLCAQFTGKPEGRSALDCLISPAARRERPAGYADYLEHLLKKLSKRRAGLLRSSCAPRAEIEKLDTLAAQLRELEQGEMR